LLLNLAIDFWALFATMLCLHGDGEGTRLGADGTVTLAISALLIAFTPSAPRPFAINGAWLIIAGLDLCVAITVRAVRATMFCWLRDFKGAR